jgi:lipoprotein-anchoring transpeptidase ErfK/SrfK
VKALYTIVTYLLLSFAFVSSAQASIKVIVDKSEQTMRVYENGEKIYTWDVSTGRNDSWTKNGTFDVQFLSPDHKSSRYDDGNGNPAPMPWAIFFNGNIAIHGTTAVSVLGQRDSHGCVRLHPKNAKVLFGMVKQDTSQVQIIVRN